MSLGPLHPGSKGPACARRGSRQEGLLPPSGAVVGARWPGQRWRTLGTHVSEGLLFTLGHTVRGQGRSSLGTLAGAALSPVWPRGVEEQEVP